MSTICKVSSLENDDIERIINDMGDQWISFKNGARSKGYWVKIEERTVRYAAAFFAVTLFQEKEGAALAAREFRNDFIRKHRMVPSEFAGDIPSRRYNNTANLSGLSGVRLSFTLSRDKDMYYVRWVAQVATGPVSFGISKFGFDEAYKKAVGERLEYIHQSDTMEKFKPLDRKYMEGYLKDKFGDNWKNKVFNYHLWWPQVEENGVDLESDNKHQASRRLLKEKLSTFTVDKPVILTA